MIAPPRVVGWLKEVSWHSIVYGLGAALQAGLNVLLLPLYTGQFPADEFGIFQMVAASASLAGALFYLGAYSSLSRYYFDASDDENRRKVAGTAVALTLAGAVMQLVAAFVFSPALSQALFGTRAYAGLLIVGFAGSAVTFVNQIFLLVLRLRRRSTAVVTVNLAALVLTVGAIFWLLVVRDEGVMGALAGTVIGQAAILPVVIWLVRRDLAWAPSREDVRTQLMFGLPAVMIGIGYYALDQSDRYVLAKRGSLTDVGIYSLGYRIGMVVQLVFVQPFAQIWNPMRLEYRKEEHAPRLFALVLTYYTLLGLIMVTALSLLSPEIISIAGRRPEYVGAAAVVPIVLFSHLVYGSVNVLDTGILVNNRLRYYVGLLWGALTLNVLLNLWLVPTFGYMGSAWATLISYVVLVVCVFAVSHKLMPISTEPGRLLTIIGSAVAAVLAGRLFPDALGWDLAWRIVLLLAVLAFWGLVVLTSQERQWLRSGAGRIGGFLGGARS